MASKSRDGEDRHGRIDHSTRYDVGDREGNLRRAIEMISGKMNPIKMSSVYETEPMY